MANNFLISLRNDTGGGVPGTSFGTETAYIEVPDGSTNYNLQARKDQGQWRDDIPDSSVLVFIHGFGNDSYNVMARHNTIKPHVPPGMTLVSFDWPSGNPGVSAYKYDRQYAASSAPYFIRDCLRVLLGKFQPADINLFTHSMGAYVAEQAFLTPGEVFTVGHVLLAAADVDQSLYTRDTPTLGTYLTHCRDLSVYWSTDDQALIESARINPYVPLGLKGFDTRTKKVPDRCANIDCGFYYRGWAKDDPPPPLPPLPPSPPNLPPPAMGEAEYSHVWYLLFAPKPPPVNDFYTDFGAVLRELLTKPTRDQSPYDPANFALKRPTA
jgi:pimeloyl-ACP methyl ester carboxylesterase